MPEGKWFIPGFQKAAKPVARVRKADGLIAIGPAYRENIEDRPRWSEIRREIKPAEFPKL